MGTRLKLEGGRNVKQQFLPFLQCPFCFVHSETGFMVDKFGKVKCNNCQIQFDESQLKRLLTRKYVITCRVCKEEIPLTKEHENLMGHSCPFCHNMVSISFGNEKLQPKEIMSLNWNEDLTKRSCIVRNNLFFLKCTTNKDIFILKLLQLLAKDEDTGFFIFREDFQKGALFFDGENNEYVGFVVWREEEKAILQQIYVLKNKRRQGHGTKILDYWINNIADNIAKDFYVEQPNKKCANILKKSSYTNEKESPKYYILPSKM